METTLKVEGMSCEHCVKHVSDALREVAGVTQVNVNLKAKNAVVSHDAAVTPAALRAAVIDAGYEAPE